MLGVEQRTLSRLIATAAIDAHARELRLAISDQAMADMIRSDPAFQGADGKFSRKTSRLPAPERPARPANGHAAQGRNARAADRQPVHRVSPPQDLIDVLHRYRDETRVIEFFTPDFDKLIKVAEPDEAKLQEYYEQNKRRFTTPELRKINALLVTRDAVKARITVTEEESRPPTSDKENSTSPRSGVSCSSRSPTRRRRRRPTRS